MSSPGNKLQRRATAWRLSTSTIFSGILTLFSFMTLNAAPKAFDMGGNIRAYAAEVARLNQIGAVKVISGVCASACTMYLGVKKVCVTPDAEVWFHAAQVPGRRDPDPLGSLEMLSYYPRRVRAWAIQVGALENTKWDNAKVLTGRQLIALGVPVCHGR